MRTAPLPTQTFEEPPALEPTLVGSAWRYRWLVLACLALAVGAALAYLMLRPVSYLATASLVVEDPGTPSLTSVRAPQPPDRYVADQVAILASPVVAERAAEIVGERLGSPYSADDMLLGSSLAQSPDSSEISITFEAAGPEEARTGADALAEAYQELRRAAAQETTASALTRVDATLARIDQELAAIERGLEVLLVDDPLLDEQLRVASARVAELEEARAQTDDSEELEDIRAELLDLEQQLVLLNHIRELRADQPDVIVLLDRQGAALSQRAELAARRNQLEVDLELAPDGVVLFSPAQFVRLNRGPAVRVLAFAVVLGGLIGTALAYWLALRRRRVTSRSEPALVLGAPLLAEVPDFSQEGIKSDLPVRIAPRSASAEAFRFAAAALDIQILSTEVRSLVWVSAQLKEGKTTLLANTAMAAAREGSRVLAIDADFGAQALTRSLFGDATPDVGITEVVGTGLPLPEALKVVPLGVGVRLSLLSRGRQPVTAPDFFRSAEVRELMAEVRDEFDLVLIDAPSLLQVAYATSLVALADGVVVVVVHGSPVAELQELAGRLKVLDASVAGYVYNRAPLRPEMTRSEGSMRDVLGVEAEAPRGRGAHHARGRRARRERSARSEQPRKEERLPGQ